MLEKGDGGEEEEAGADGCGAPDGEDGCPANKARDRDGPEVELGLDGGGEAAGKESHRSMAG